MSKITRVVAWLCIVFGFVFAALVVSMIAEDGIPSGTFPLLLALCVIAFAASPSIGGIGLLQRKPWARIVLFGYIGISIFGDLLCLTGVSWMNGHFSMLRLCILCGLAVILYMDKPHLWNMTIDEEIEKTEDIKTALWITAAVAIGLILIVWVYRIIAASIGLTGGAGFGTFIHSIGMGFSLLASKYVWIDIAAYVVVTGIFMLSVAVVSAIGGSAREGLGCAAMVIGRPLLHSLLLSAIIMHLLPILTGGTSPNSLNQIKELVPVLLLIGLIASVAVGFLSILPVLGSLITSNTIFELFLESVVIYRIVMSGMLPHKATNPSLAYPGFWESVGYVVVTTILIFIGLGVTTFLKQAYNSLRKPYCYRIEEDSEPGAITQWIVLLLCPILGLLPLFMYASYVRLATPGLG
jgi:hypothetical protein